MKHQLNIRVSKDPQSGGSSGIVRCRNVTIREKLLTWLLGRKEKVMILVPGNSVDTVSIVNLAEGGTGGE